MKTKNNVQKAILRSVAVIISFVLISFTVSAREFWKKLITNSSFNEIVVAMIEPANSNVVFEETNRTLEFNMEQDNELNLEGWMLNEDFFNASENNETPLELEDWMISDAIWNN